MSTSNLSTVIAPSLIWMSPKRIDHTSAIMHTQYTNKAIEVMIRNSYHIFGMDRQADWQSFFSRYSVEEPPKEEEEEDCGNESDIEDDIEDLDEQDRSDEDDDEEIFLPPTPDILKTTRKPVEQTTSLPNPKCKFYPLNLLNKSYLVILMIFWILKRCPLQMSLNHMILYKYA